MLYLFQDSSGWGEDTGGWGDDDLNWAEEDLSFPNSLIDNSFHT